VRSTRASNRDWRLWQFAALELETAQRLASYIPIDI
jgi:hypothetical protein